MPKEAFKQKLLVKYKYNYDSLKVIYIQGLYYTTYQSLRNQEIMGDELKNGRMVNDIEGWHFKERSQAIQREVKNAFHCGL